MFRFNHTEYTRKELQNLWTKMARLPVAIEKNQGNLAQLQADLTKLELKLAALVEKEIEPNQKTMTALQAQIDVLTLSAMIDEFTKKIERHQTELNALLPQQKEVSDKLPPVIERIGKFESAIKTLEERVLLVQKNVELATARRDIDARQLVLNRLRAELAAAEQQRSMDDSMSALQPVQGETQRLSNEIDKQAADCSAAEAAKQKLSDEILALAHDIESNVRKLAGFSCPNNLPALKDLLTQETVKKEALDQQLKKITSTIESHRSQSVSLTNDRDTKQSKLDEAKLLSAQFTGNNNTRDLQAQLVTAKQLWFKLEKKRDGTQLEINEQKRKIVAEEDVLKANNKELADLETNHFVSVLANNPASLLDALCLRLQRKLAEYESDHPESDHLSVRSCLLTLENKVNFILQQRAVQGGPKETLRLHYYQISGLLWDAYQKTAKKNPLFAEAMVNVLGKDVIQQADAVSVYAALRKNNLVALRDYNQQDIDQHDETEFAAASKRFYDELKKGPPYNTRHDRNFYHRGNDLLQAINSQKKLCINKRSFDVKLHTEILKVSTELLSNPDNHVLCDRFDLLKHPKHKLDGQRSIAKIVIGAMSMFLGGALLVVGSMILAGMAPVLSWQVAATGIVIGAALFTGGIALCVNGRKKGTHKAVESFDAAREKVLQARTSQFISATMFHQRAEKKDDSGVHLDAPAFVA